MEEKCFIVCCDKCKKEAEIDKKQSNKNWIVYKKINHKCKCGGIFKPQVK